MRNSDILILGGHEIDALLAGREQDILHSVAQAYLAHERGASALPHSLFLRFPDAPKNRIIALPAYLGGEFEVAGIKWIASFPDNVAHGIDRASATIILNSMETGRPTAILEGSLISAKRTAASAALGARALHGGTPARVGLVGCGVISFEILRFLRAVFPELRNVILFDTLPDRAEQFGARCTAELGRDLDISVAPTITALLESCPLVAFATTAATPHLSDLAMCPPGGTILHISLRDLSPEVILANENIVDDVDHVTRAQTSIHLAEQQTGNRDFIRGTLAQVLDGTIPAREDPRRLAIFSPFGLGVLDLAVGQLVYQQAQATGRGTAISNFLPDSWAR